MNLIPKTQVGETSQICFFFILSYHRLGNLILLAGRKILVVVGWCGLSPLWECVKVQEVT